MESRPFRGADETSVRPAPPLSPAEKPGWPPLWALRLGSPAPLHNSSAPAVPPGTPVPTTALDARRWPLTRAHANERS
mgnify:CR=1 FL=1